MENSTLTLNIICALLGVNVFTVPWGFSQSGSLGGTIVTILVALLSYKTTTLMLMLQIDLFRSTRGKVVSYSDIVTYTLGSSLWGLTVQVSTVVSCIGTCIAYLIFMSEVTSQLLHVSTQRVLLWSIAPLVLISWIQSYSRLSVFTSISVLISVVAVVVVLAIGLTDSDSKPPRWSDVPWLKLETIHHYLGPATFSFTVHYCVLALSGEALVQGNSQSRDKHVELDKGRDGSFAATAPNGCDVLESYDAHEDDEEEGGAGERGAGKGRGGTGEDHVSYTDGGGVRNNDPGWDEQASSAELDSAPFLREGGLRESFKGHQDHPPVVDLGPAGLSHSLSVAYLFCGGFLILTGLLGSLAFSSQLDSSRFEGEIVASCDGSVCQNFILNCPPSHIRDGIGVALYFAVLFGYVLLLIPAAEQMESVLDRIPMPLHKSVTTRIALTRLLRALVVCFTVWVALSFPFIGQLLGYIGGITDCYQAFILPPLVSTFGTNRVSLPSRLLLLMIFMWGIFTSTSTLYGLFLFGSNGL